MKFRVIGVAAVVATLLSPVATGDIALVDRAGTPDARVCVYSEATGNLTPVGPGQWDGAPRWSPDGVWLAFETAGAAGGRAVHVVRHDGSGGRTLRHGQAWNIAPRWSTDGTRLVYNGAPAEGGLTAIRTYDLNEDTESAWGGGAVGLVAPVWLPYSQLMWALDPDTELAGAGVDMKRFLQEGRLGQLSILSGALPDAVIALQVLPGAGRQGGLGSTAVLVTKSEVLPFLDVALADEPRLAGTLWQIEPNWEDRAYDFSTASDAPSFGAYPLVDKGKATRIAYESDEGGDREIYVIGTKGRTNVTNHRAADWNPVWSPDGRRLAFESFRDGPRGVYVVFTDTALVSAVAAGAGASWSPTWSPDGARLAYLSDRDGKTALYVQAESGAAEKLTDGTGALAHPTWRPESTQ